jgi:anti-sigma B factor antagonist
MELAIGVFDSRDRAEEAVKELCGRGVQEDGIVFLTRSEVEAKAVAAQYSNPIERAAGISASAVINTFEFPAVGTVFVVGAGGAALIGLTAKHNTANERRSEEVQFYRDMLKADRSCVVVRTDSRGVAAIATNVLDRYGLGIQGDLPTKMAAVPREVGDITVVDFRGRITLGDGNARVRELVGQLLDEGRKKILFNLAEVQYVDSSGLAELVKAHSTIRNHGGSLKLTHVNKRVHDLLHVTHLDSVFEILVDEKAAMLAFSGQQGPTTAAS